MAQAQIEGTGENRESLIGIIWETYTRMNRHAHSAEVWEEVLKDPRVSEEILAGLARQSGIRAVAESMKVKNPDWGVARAWKTPDGWGQLLLLTADEMAHDIAVDAKQVTDDMFQLRKKRDVMFSFHGWAPEIPEIAGK